MLTYLTAFLGIVILVGGFVIWRLRRKGIDVRPSADDEATGRELKKAFGTTSAWGMAGNVDSESARHHDDGGDSTSSSSDSSDGGSGGGGD